MNTTKMNSTKVKTIDDLPDLPFERILNYLSLLELLKSRAVSRGWYHRINCFKVKSICCSQHPKDLISEKRHLIKGAFAQNFISSSQLASFFERFAPTILADLKYLLLCDVSFNAKNVLAFQALNSLVQLEVLSVIGFDKHPGTSNQETDIELNLPMLNSIHLESVREAWDLTLNTPRLKKVVFIESAASMNFVHHESVEKLITDGRAQIATENLKNLEQLHVEYFENFQEMFSGFLSHLEQLKELYLYDQLDVWQAFEEKRRYVRTDLKIYYIGLLVNGPEDPAIESRFSRFFEEKILVHLANNPTRLADEIPFFRCLSYETIQLIAPESTVKLLKLFTDLDTVYINEPVQDSQNFLDLLNSIDSIVRLTFRYNQPQELFNRLPEHCVVQSLTIRSAHPDLRFLFRLKHLLYLELDCPMHLEFVRKIWEKLPFLNSFHFLHADKMVKMRIDHSSIHPKPFKVSVVGKKTLTSDLNAAIQFIVKNTNE